MKYECSSRGDKRFSAFYARLADGRSIEQHYQCDVKGYDPGGTNWKLGKGKPPLKPMDMEEQFKAYCRLWYRYFQLNPDLAREIRAIADTSELTDSFATTRINQAAAITWLLQNNHI